MSSSHPESVQSEVKRYWKVFFALTIGTIITVAIAKFHMPWISVAIGLAALVAIVKGSLVAAYFMHLAHERKLIYLVLILTAGGVAIMISLILLTRSDQQGLQHGVFQVPQRFVDPAMVHGEAHHGSGPGADAPHTPVKPGHGEASTPDPSHPAVPSASEAHGETDSSPATVGPTNAAPEKTPAPAAATSAEPAPAAVAEETADK